MTVNGASLALPDPAGSAPATLVVGENFIKVTSDLL